jgi:hypothetical protein
LIAYHSDAQDTWDQHVPWLQLAFNTAEHESTKVPPFAVMFPFRASSPLLNKWKIHELLPEKCNPRSLRERWNKNTIHFKQRLLPNCLLHDLEIVTVNGGESTSQYHTLLTVAKFTGKWEKIRSRYFIATPRMHVFQT